MMYSNNRLRRWWHWNGDGCVIVVVLIMLFAVILGISVAASYYTSRVSCEHLAEMNPDYQFDYAFWTGCRVWVNGFWISSGDVIHVLLDE